MKEYFRFQEFDAEVSIDNKTEMKRCFIMAVANSSQYGNNIKIAPLASVRDGLLHLTIMKKIPLYRLDYILSFLRGSFTNSEMFELLEGKTVRIKTAQPVPYHIDGEPCGFNNSFDIQLKPASLSVLVPDGQRQAKV